MVEEVGLSIYIADSPYMADGLKKIGHGDDIGNRMRSLATGCPGIRAVEAYDMPNEFEKYLHKFFSEYREVGEWFRLPPDWPARIEHAIRSYRYGLTPRQAERGYAK